MTTVHSDSPLNCFRTAKYSNKEHNRDRKMKRSWSSTSMTQRSATEKTPSVLSPSSFQTVIHRSLVCYARRPAILFSMSTCRAWFVTHTSNTRVYADMFRSVPQNRIPCISGQVQMNNRQRRCNQLALYFSRYAGLTNIPYYEIRNALKFNGLWSVFLFPSGEVTKNIRIPNLAGWSCFSGVNQIDETEMRVGFHERRPRHPRVHQTFNVKTSLG